MLTFEPTFFFMKFIKRTLIFLLAAFIVIQFFHPEKNISDAAPANHISKSFPFPGNIKEIVSNSCYDCHSNNTRYPWYYHIQPVAWWMNDHIQEGKSHLNFDEFASYRPRRQYSKFGDTKDMIKEDEMPLSSYILGHPRAALSPEQKQIITAWCNNCMSAMKAIYPLDSLIKH